MFYDVKIVMKQNWADLNGFLHHVVKYEQDKDGLTRHDEVITHSHVADQFHRAERPGGNGATSCRELHQKSGDIREKCSQSSTARTAINSLSVLHKLNIFLIAI